MFVNGILILYAWSCSTDGKSLHGSKPTKTLYGIELLGLKQVDIQWIVFVLFNFVVTMMRLFFVYKNAK